MTEQRAPDPLIGKILAGKWRVESLLGAGGMAKVYAAEHRNGHKVAIKVLNPELSAVTEARERFLREGYAANHIEHPGVVLILDDDVTPTGTVFLVMERLHGRALDARIALEPRLGVHEALFIADRVLEVLGRAHDRGIVHRDVKPENIFLTLDGSVKVLDFGIARVRSATNANTTGDKNGTLAGGIMGTPAYMSPEQARGRFDEVDGRSDLFSLGMVLWSMLAGRQARQATTVNEVLFQAMSHTVPSIGTVVTGAIPALVELVDRATAQEREHRWSSAEAMRAELLEVWKLLGHGDAISPPEAEKLVGPDLPKVEDTPSGPWPESMPIAAKTVRLEDLPGGPERFSSLPPAERTPRNAQPGDLDPGTLDPWSNGAARSRRTRVIALVALAAAATGIVMFARREVPPPRTPASFPTGTALPLSPASGTSTPPARDPATDAATTATAAAAATSPKLLPTARPHVPNPARSGDWLDQRR